MLQDKTIIITGAASGLGRAWTLGFLKEGARVAALDVNAESLSNLKAVGAMTYVCDVMEEETVRQVFAEVLESTGRIDVLFNNAGIGINRLFLNVPEGEFERHIAIHLYGAVYGMRAALPVMKAQGYGRIINTISRAAEIAGPRNAAYAAAKAALWATSRSVSAELENENILINMLIPGPTNTAIWGRDMPNMQSPEVTFPTAKMLATLPNDGPRGEVYWDEKPYPLFKNDVSVP